MRSTLTTGPNFRDHLSYTHAPRCPVSDVCRRAAAAYRAPCSNTKGQPTDKSTKVCVWASNEQASVAAKKIKI